MTTIFRFYPTGSFITVGIPQPENVRRNDIYLTPHLADKHWLTKASPWLEWQLGLYLAGISQISLAEASAVKINQPKWTEMKGISLQVSYINIAWLIEKMTWPLLEWTLGSYLIGDPHDHSLQTEKRCRLKTMKPFSMGKCLSSAATLEKTSQQVQAAKRRTMKSCSLLTCCQHVMSNMCLLYDDPFHSMFYVLLATTNTS